MGYHRRFAALGPMLIAGALLLLSLGFFDITSATATVDSPDLNLISEMTGYVAATTDLGAGCSFDAEYGVYLCQELEPETVPQPDAAARARALEMLVTEGLLLVPESTNDRVMAFDPTTGMLVDADFIPADPDNLSTPIHAIPSPNGDGYLVSDQIDDVVQLYDLAGGYVGVFAPAGGPNPAILDNVRGIAVTSDGRVLVSVGSGANADAIAAFDSDGNSLGNFVANGAGGLDSPFDIIERSADFLVSAITSDAIHRYDSVGAPLTNLTAIDTFPEQLAEIANGNILVGNFSGSAEGVVEYDGSGVQIGVYDVASLGGYRGAYELGNGNILTTNGGGVHEIDRSSNLIESETTGVSARFIQYVEAGMSVTQTVQLGSSGCGTEQTIVANPGETVTFCYTMSNVGDFQWVTHTITDSVNGTILSGATAVITPGTSISIEQTYVVPGSEGGNIDNCANWSASNAAFALAEASCVTVVVGGPTDVALATFTGSSASTWGYWSFYALITALGTAAFAYRRRQHLTLQSIQDEL